MRAMYEAFPRNGSGFHDRRSLRHCTGSRTRDSTSSFNDTFQGRPTIPSKISSLSSDWKWFPPSTGARAYSGLSVHESNGACIVRSVLSDGPAYPAGVNCGDEIVTLERPQIQGCRDQSSPRADHGAGRYGLASDHETKSAAPNRLQARHETKSAVGIPQDRFAIEEQRAAYESWLGCSF